MDWWKEGRYGDGISMLENDGLEKSEARILNISVKEDGAVIFTEECDLYYSSEYTKGEAICLLQEAIEFIRSSGP
ncbi:hypothetical protein [Pseudomonas sp.]|uniref:hypothetical protein n=1 Tax=Pseudomonas sp. TaxID=306 RepID=UPI00333FDA52